jgi:hypothetical protein
MWDKILNLLWPRGPLSRLILLSYAPFRYSSPILPTSSPSSINRGPRASFSCSSSIAGRNSYIQPRRNYCTLYNRLYYGGFRDRGSNVPRCGRQRAAKMSIIQWAGNLYVLRGLTVAQFEHEDAVLECFCGERKAAEHLLGGRAPLTVR